VVINIAVIIFAFRFAAARRLSIRDVVPGALASAVVWQLLQSFGVIYVRHVLKHSSASNAVFTIVLGLLAYLYIASSAVLLCTEINVVRVNRLSPRALLTPFTDNVELTAGDRRAYSRQAKAQRIKGFQRIHVDFTRRKREPDQSTPPEHEPDQDEPGPGTPG
jgi:hypothetical protein